MVRASSLLENSYLPPSNLGIWHPNELTGRLCELSTNHREVHLTLTCNIIHAYQRIGEPVSWITTTRNTFFPPDVAQCGIDLLSLPVVTVPDLRALVTVAEQLTRCGTFGLIVLEIGVHMAIRMGHLGLLSRLARRHNTALLCLTVPCHERTLGSPIALRGRGFRIATSKSGYFQCGIHVCKDRNYGPGRSLTNTYRAPYSLY